MEDEWTVDATEATTISLARPSPKGTEKIAAFKPSFTYPIFGKDERIFGYKGLRINIEYDARDLRPNLTITSDKKFSTVGDVEALDVKETMKEYLPAVAFQSKKEFGQALRMLPDTWTPPGSLLKTLEKNGEVYEIWYGTLADPAILQIIKRVQLMALFFIEGGSYIGEDADGNDEPEHSLARWTVFFAYKKGVDSEAAGKTQYTFQGYATVYTFWMYQQPTPPASPSSEKETDLWDLSNDSFTIDQAIHRKRISQFIILPPFQGKGIGAFLYNTIFELGLKTATTKEVTVEDPNEDFDLLRDLCDLKYLLKNVPEFAELEVNTDIHVPTKAGILHHNTKISSRGNESSDGIVDIVKLEEIRVQNKIAPRQFWRLVEMHLMSKLPDSVRPEAIETKKSRSAAPKADKHAYMLWRLLLKQRLYRRNASVLGEFEITERIIKLNETVDNVEWEYAIILERFASKPPVANGKRTLDDDLEATGSSSKKARVEDLK